MLPNHIGKKLSSESESKPGDHESNAAIPDVQPLNPGVVLESLEGVPDLRIGFRKNHELQFITGPTSPF